MRAVLLVLLVACGKADAPVDGSETAGPTDTVVEPCATWDDYACNGVGNGCYAQCLEALKISCANRQCTLQGVGMGAGKSCQISVGDREDGCGLCETAWEECR